VFVWPALGGGDNRGGNRGREEGRLQDPRAHAGRRGLIVINVSTELEMTSDARHNGGKALYVKHCKCA